MKELTLLQLRAVQYFNPIIRPCQPKQPPATDKEMRALQRRPQRRSAALIFFASAVDAFQPHYVEEISIQPLPLEREWTNAINCSLFVKAPLDVAPVRSPQAIHSYIAQRVAGKSIVEIGTRASVRPIQHKHIHSLLHCTSC